MAKIALLLPKSDINEALSHILEGQAVNDTSLHIVCHDNIDETMKNVIQEGYLVVVSRGCYIVQIKQKYQIPAVEIRLTSKELNDLITLASLMSEKEQPHISIIDFSEAVYDLERFHTTSSTKIVRYRVQTEAEVSAVVKQAAANGTDIIIGGDTASRQAVQLGIPHLYLAASEDSLREALRVAQSVRDAISVQKEQIAQLETLLNYSFNGIMKINRDGEVIICNLAAESSLGLNSSQILGAKLPALVPDITPELLAEVLTHGREIFSAVFQLRRNSIIANLAPIVTDQKIIGAIFSWHEVKRLEKYESKIRRELYPLGYMADYQFNMLHGCSKILQSKIAAAKLYAHSDAPVLISGSTGTEKEILAQCIHNAGTRAAFPYVAVDPGSQPEHSQASFLFGYSDGDDVQNGLLSQAHGGTAFFREISTLTLPSQQLLLRLLQNKTLTCTGNERPLPVNIRVIASTKRNLPALVAEGKFNKALYYYLNRLFLHIPPLAERKEDIQFWLKQYLHRYSKVYQKYVYLTKGADHLLSEYPWNGNLIQLDSFCEQLIITTPHQRINEHQIASLLNEMFPANSNCDGYTAAAPQLVMTSEQEQIKQALIKYHGNRTLASKELGISTSTLWRRLKKYGILSTSKL